MSGPPCSDKNLPTFQSTKQFRAVLLGCLLLWSVRAGESSTKSHRSHQSPATSAPASAMPKPASSTAQDGNERNPFSFVLQIPSGRRLTVPATEGMLKKCHRPFRNTYVCQFHTKHRGYSHEQDETREGAWARPPGTSEAMLRIWVVTPVNNR